MHSGWSLLDRATTVNGANPEGGGSDAPTKEGHVLSQDKMGDDVVGTTVDGNPEEAKTDGVGSSNTVDGGAPDQLAMATESLR